MGNKEAIPISGIILAGGSGTRFWPLSRSLYPKQVLRLLGSESLLQATVERLLPRIPLARLAVVTNAAKAPNKILSPRRQGAKKKGRSRGTGLLFILAFFASLREINPCAWRPPGPPPQIFPLFFTNRAGLGDFWGL